MGAPRESGCTSTGTRIGSSAVSGGIRGSFSGILETVTVGEDDRDA